MDCRLEVCHLQGVLIRTHRHCMCGAVTWCHCVHIAYCWWLININLIQAIQYLVHWWGNAFDVTQEAMSNECVISLWSHTSETLQWLACVWYGLHTLLAVLTLVFHNYSTWKLMVSYVWGTKLFFNNSQKLNAGHSQPLSQSVPSCFYVVL